MADHKQTATSVLQAVGGKDNIASASHCVTRLRFHVKDEAKVNVEEIKQIPGVMGYQKSGEQHQVIIGPTVGHVFEEVEKILGSEIADHNLVEDPATKEKKKITVGSILNSLIAHMTGCIYPALVIFVAAGLIRAIPAILGPEMLGIISAESNVLMIFNMIYEAGFYFLPVFLGYSSAKHFGVNPFIGMFLGAILVSPTLIGWVDAGVEMTYFGVPVMMNNYSTSVLPVILIVWIASYVERLLKKISPAKLETLIVPCGTVLIMSFVGLCFLAPLGYIAGSYIATALFWLHSVLGPAGTAVMGALYLLLIMTGMHHTVNMVGLTAFLANGFDDFLFVSFSPAWGAVIGVAVAFAIKAKKPENKSLGWSSTFLQGVVGVAEPALYGIMLPYKKVLFSQILGAFVGALYLGITGVKVYTFLGSNFLCLMHYAGNTTGNLVNGIIGTVLAAAIAFVGVMVLGFDENANKA